MTLLLNSLILTFYFIIYGLVHSWLASLSFKQWLREQLGDDLMRGYRLSYNIFALISLLPFFILQATLTNPKLYTIPSPWRWLMVMGQLLALIGATITLWQTGAGHFLGISQVIKAAVTENTPLNISGFYRWVRHPLYFFGLLFIWLSPVMYLNQLIGYLLFSLYFYFGSIYEERKLVTEFGELYQNYQQEVPRLFPYLTKKS